MVTKPEYYTGLPGTPPAVTPPSVPPSITYTLYNAFTLDANEILYFQSDVGIMQDGVGLLTNSGLMYVVSGASGSSATGIADGVDNPTVHTFDNTTTGVLTVVASGASGDAYGYNSGSNPVAIMNQGVIQAVALNGNAVGSVNYGGSPGATFTNAATGLVAVWASGAGIGLYYAQAGVSLINKGLIYVTADTAIGVEGANSFDNTGRIIAVDNTTGETSVGVDVSAAATLYGGTGVFTNSGTVRADVAFKFDTSGYTSPYAGDITIDNSGKVFGKIDFSTSSGNTTINNTGTIDGVVDLGGGNNVYDGAGGKQTSGIYLGAGANNITLGADGESVYGAETGGVDSITGGAGNDFIEIYSGSDSIDGGGGVNTLSFASATSGATVDLATGVATCGGTDHISHINIVIGSTNYDNKLTAGATAAKLIAGAHQDELIGGAGNDTLVAGLGGDTATGGGGNNLFVYSKGDHQLFITDFRQNGDDDKLEIYGYAKAKSITQVGANTIIDLSSTDLIQLKNTNAKTLDLAALDFLPDSTYSLSTAAPVAAAPRPTRAATTAAPTAVTHTFVSAMAALSYGPAAISPALDTIQRLAAPNLLASRY